MINYLRNILRENEDTPFLFQRNIIKEYLQVLTLSFLYLNPRYQSLIFYGGSCLRHCFGLPRLSEDLDFVDISTKVELDELGDELKKYFWKKHGIKTDITIQKFRIYLKFPILDELNLVSKGASKLLILKTELFRNFDFCQDYRIEILPLFRFGESVLVRTFDLPTLMATKIMAIFSRKWEKTDKRGRTLAKVKGRDYYDLMWYLTRGIKPNLHCIVGIKDGKELKEKLLSLIEGLDTFSIKFDLDGLIKDRNIVEDIGNNLKQILITQLASLK